MVAKPLCPLYKNIIKPLDRARYPELRYRYADPDYSITEMPLSIEDCKLIKKAIILLENKKDKNNEDTIQVLNKVQDRLKSILNFV